MTNKPQRKASTIAELELLFTISLLHKKVYFQKRPFKFLLHKIGFFNPLLAQECTNIAMTELTDVDYDYERWRIKYGKDMMKF